MKRLLLVIVLLLTACANVPVPDAYTDPVVRAGYANVEAKATDTQLDAAMRATDQYDQSARMVATQTALVQAAEATDLALDHIADQSTQIARETRQAATATRSAIVTQEHMDGAALITQQFVDGAATLEAFNVTQRAALYQSQQQSQQATLEAKRIESEYKARGFLIWGLAIVAVIGFAVVVLALSGLSLPVILPPILKVLGETKSRFVVAVGIRDSLRGRDMMASVSNLPTATGGVPDLEMKIVPGKSRATVPGETISPAEFSHLHPDNRDAMIVVEKMAGIVGGHTQQLPSAKTRTEHNMYNTVAQPVINALVKTNDLTSRDGAGVFVNKLKWRDLDDLAQGLRDGRIDLRGQIEWDGNKRPTPQPTNGSALPVS